jgi:4-amino-4-deoxy-L-arabinose transferase-like glycosyltransferase
VLTRQTAAAGLAAALAVRDHVPLLYWLTTAALRLLPEHEVTLRLVSALAGVLAVPLLVALGRVAGRPRAGLWAALLLAVSPFAIRYSQEARHYALLLLFGLLATVLLLRALGRDRRRDWLAYGLAAALGLLTHYSAWLLLLAQAGIVAGWLLGRLRAEGRGAAARLAPAAAVVGLALLLLAPGAAEAVRANTAAAAGTTAAAPLPVWLRELWLEFGFGRAGPALLLGLAAAGGAVALARRRPAAAGVLLISAVAPVLFIQVLGISRFALAKYVIYLLPMYLFAAGVAVDVVAGWWALVGRRRLGLGKRPAAGVAAALMGVAVLLVAWLPVAEEYGRMVHDWRGAAAALGAAGRRGPAAGPGHRRRLQRRRGGRPDLPRPRLPAHRWQPPDAGRGGGAGRGAGAGVGAGVEPVWGGDGGRWAVGGGESSGVVV